MLHKRKQRNKPLKSFTQSMLHSKSTYFYKQWFYRSIPYLCAVSLLVLGLGLINPISSQSSPVHAAINEDLGNGSTISMAIMNDGNEVADEGVISTDVETGQMSYIDNTIKIITKKISKYYVGIQAASDSSSELIGKNHAAIITGVGNNVNVKDFADNVWGYALTDQSATENARLSYSTLPTYSASTSPQYQSAQNPDDGEHILKLTFAAKIRADKPADHYQTKALVSIAAEAKTVATLDEITYMQDISSDTCYYSNQADAAGNYQYQLTDKRDDKTYWVAKLKDGNCWMTQNLALDLKTTQTLTNELSDVSGWTPSKDTQQGGTLVYDSNNMSMYTYNPGEYVYTTPIAQTFCSDSTLISNCPNWTLISGLSKDRNRNEQAHYLAGVYYTYNAATAGTGTTISSGDATGSICPKGWGLPTSTQLKALVSGSTASTSITNNNLKLAPDYFVYTGRLGGTKLDGFSVTGQYWSSTANGPVYSGALSAKYLFFNSDEIKYDSVATYEDGKTVRCVAR